MAKFFLVGMMGVGKTSFSKKWAKRHGLEAFDLDNLIEEKEQMTVNEIFSQKGEVYFRQAESDLLKTFSEKDNFILATGGGVPCFHENMDWMNQNGITIWLDEEIELLFGRLRKAKAHRPLLRDLNDEQLKDYIEKKMNERNIFYAKAKHSFRAEEISNQSFDNLINTLS